MKDKSLRRFLGVEVKDRFGTVVMRNNDGYSLCGKLNQTEYHLRRLEEVCVQVNDKIEALLSFLDLEYQTKCSENLPRVMKKIKKKGKKK